VSSVEVRVGNFNKRFMWSSFLQLTDSGLFPNRQDK
jgi:hypothetical protein